MANNEFVGSVNTPYLTPISDHATIQITSVKDTITIKDNFRHPYWGEVEINVIGPNGERTQISNTTTGSGSYTLKGEGTYTLRYSGNIDYTDNIVNPPITVHNPFDISFLIVGVKNYDPLPKWNIASVIERVLDVAEPHLQGVAPRFALHPTQAKQFSAIESPEFAFTKCTLKEILDQIGGFIHGVPRLNGNVISYDMLGGTDQAKIADPKYPYVSNVYTQNIESYCTGLDSTVDNLVCLLDEEQGTLTEPYEDGYKTVRTETVYARVEENNMYIATQYPIQKIKSVKCGFIPGTNVEGGDLTPYVFELSEYNRMSGYSETYPNSKVFALYYTQGTKNIYGLNYKIPKAAGQVFGQYAIIRILENTTGQTINTNNFNYPLLAFQVSYIPIFNARVQQTKQYIGEITEPRTLVYNQGANLVETRYYGENLKGVVARMGNVDRVVTYNLGDFSLVPKIGQLYGEDYYISGVTCEFQQTYIRCMLSLSQDFNRLSQYIGINSVQRFYEVSEKQAYQRDIKYADYVVIGDSVEQDVTLLRSISHIKNTFVQAAVGTDGIACVVANKDGSENENTLLLPVISTAQGNAMVFTFHYQDNYSAGSQVEYENSGGISGYFTNSVAYADYYGRFDGLYFRMLAPMLKPSTPEAQESIGKKLPIWNERESGIVIGTTDRPLTVRKDGSEILSVNYVLEFVTNKKNYIIGSTLARNCTLVRGRNREHYAKLYILQDRLSKFATVVDLTGATELRSYRISNAITELSANQIKFSDETATVNGEAWAIVDSVTGELLLGSNEPIEAGQTLQMPYMTLRHDIFNRGGKKQ